MKDFKPLTFFLIIAIIIGIIPKFALAEETLPEPSEKQGFLQPIEQKTEVPEGYTGIYTAEDMDNIRNDLSGKYILMADIDLAPLGNWQPIGQCQTGILNPEHDSSHPADTPLLIDDRIPFTGEIDGNGYTIKNMNIVVNNTVDRMVSVGLIASAENCMVKNLGITSASLNGNVSGILRYGGIFGECCCCAIENCFSEADIVVDNKIADNIGITGFAGRVYIPHKMSVKDRLEKLIRIDDCANYGDITIIEKDGTDYEAVGICGIGGYNIRNCINAGNMRFEVSGKHAIGTDLSVSGITLGPVPVFDSINSGDISVILEDARFENDIPVRACSWIEIAGIVTGGGAMVEYNMPTENCINYGNVSIKLNNVFTVGYFTIGMGGIGGHTDFAACRNSGNEGKISFEAVDLTALSEETFGYSDICVLSIGGIFGTQHGSGCEYLTSCYNTGTIDVNVKNVTDGTAVHIGGICGGFGEEYMDEDKGRHMYFADCYNTGDITVYSDAICYVGGMAGWFSLTVPFPNDPIAYVENCYNTGNIAVTGKDKKVGVITGFTLAGNNADSNIFKLRNVYYSNTDLPCVGQSSGRVRFENNKLLTDSEMKSKESFAGFNFVKTWGIDEEINGGRPYLRAFYGDIGEAQPGDVNMDGTVNTGDAVQILKNSAGMIELDDEQEAIADMNNDGKVNTTDAVQILKYCAGM